MAERTYILLPGQGDQKPKLVDAAEGALRELGPATPGQAVLALPASWCLAARLDCDEAGVTRETGPAGSRSWRRAMQYELEDLLPMTAEDTVADFIISDDCVLGVCASLDQIRQVLEAWRAHEGACPVRAATPAAWLAAQHAAQQAGGRIDAVIVGEQQGHNLIHLREGRPLAWHWLSGDAASVMARLRELEPERAEPLRVLTLAMDPAQRTQVAESSGVELVATPEAMSAADVNVLAAQAADALVTSETPGSDLWINLQRDTLAASTQWDRLRPAAGVLITAAVVALVLVNAAIALRAARYDDVREQQIVRQQALFREAMPQATTIPADVPYRLESDLRAMREGRSTAQDAAAPVSALATYVALLQHWPEDVNVQLDSVRVDGDEVTLSGSAASHEAADELAAKLRSNAGWQVEAPKTTSSPREQAVTFQNMTLRIAQPTLTRQGAAANRSGGAGS